MAEAEVVIITGCASGIGKALARDLNRRQTPSGGQAYKVYATDFRCVSWEAYNSAREPYACLDVR